MVSVGLPEARRLALGVVAGQAAVTAVIAGACLLIAGRLAAVSALVGGGISTVASLVMVALAFGQRTGSDAQRAARAFYVGEAAKLALTVALFVLVLSTLRLSVGPLFGAYVATFFVYWIALANALPSFGGRGGARGTKG